MADWINRIYATAVYSIPFAMAIAGCTSNPPAPVAPPPPPPQLQWVRMQNDVPPGFGGGTSAPVFTACAPGGVRLYALNPGYSSGGVAMAAIDTTNSRDLGGACPKQ